MAQYYGNNEAKIQQDVYLKADVDEGKVTAAKMNQNLVDKKDTIPAGTYLPWEQDSEGKFHLKFGAPNSELYVIP